MNKLVKLVLPTMLVALMVLALSPPTHGQIQVPKLSIEQNGVAIEIITGPVCSNFTVEIWIKGISTTYPMFAFKFYVTWDPAFMEKVSYVVEKHEWFGSPSEGPSWLSLSLSGYPNTIAYDAKWMNITFHCLRGGDSTIESPAFMNDVYLWTGDPNNPFWTRFNVVNMVSVHQVAAPRPVGGILAPTNKLAVMAPYLALIGLVGVVTVAVAVQRRRKL